MLSKTKKTSSRYSGYTSRSTFINLSTRASNVPIDDLIFNVFGSVVMIVF
jgi:hypothetical protein